MIVNAPALPCPGQPSPVRPLAVVLVCRRCARWKPYSQFDEHQAPAARRDSGHWVCPHVVAVLAENESPLDVPVPPASSFSPAPLGAGDLSNR